MQLSLEALKAAILKKAETSPKPQLYIKDFYACDPETKPRVLKNAANDLVKEGKLTLPESLSADSLNSVFRLL